MFDQLVSDLAYYCNEFLKRLLFTNNKYFRTETVRLPKKNSAEVFNI